MCESKRSMVLWFTSDLEAIGLRHLSSNLNEASTSANTAKLPITEVRATQGISKGQKCSGDPSSHLNHLCIWKLESSSFWRPRCGKPLYYSNSQDGKGAHHLHMASQDAKDAEGIDLDHCGGWYCNFSCKPWMFWDPSAWPMTKYGCGSKSPLLQLTYGNWSVSSLFLPDILGVLPRVPTIRLLTKWHLSL